MSSTPKNEQRGPSESPGSRRDDPQRTEGVQATAAVLDLRAPPADEAPTVAVLHELRAVRDLLSKIEGRLVGETKAPQERKQRVPVLSDDSIIDQRTVSAPPELYLRLARAGAFPSNKIGKRICARWGDVKEAFLGPGVRSASVPTVTQGSPPDGLDGLRRQLGLAEKGK